MNRIIKDVRNPTWHQNHKYIVCEVLFELTDDLPPAVKKALKDYVPFGASPEDPEEHGQKLWSELMTGKWGTIKEAK